MARANLFADLKPTPAEQKLIAATASGEPCDLTPDGREETIDDVEKGAAWGDDRTIRAAIIVALATEARDDWRVTSKGVRLSGARIKGELDFEATKLTVRLGLFRCHLAEPIILMDTHAVGVFVQYCVIACRGRDAIEGDRLHCAGALYLRGARISGGVSLLGAKIDGDLICSGARLENPRGLALRAAGIRIAGYVFLNEKFSAKGGVGLLGADIGGNLECGGAQLENPGNDALEAERMKVGGHVLLRDRFSARGAVQLLGADIKGNLHFDGARLENAEKFAFLAEGMKVAGALFFRNLSGAPNGDVSLIHASVGQLVDDSNSWPTAGNLYLDGFTYGALAGRAPTDYKSRLDWLGRMPKEPYTPQPYEQLAKVLKQMGHETDAREILIAKQDAYLAHGEISERQKLWLKFLRWSIRYGYKPWRALYAIALVVLLSAHVFGVSYELGEMHPTKERVYLDPCYVKKDAIKCPDWQSSKVWPTQKPPFLPKDYPAFNPWFFTLDSFFPFVDFHQEDYWNPSSGNWFLRGWLWAHIAAGWILSTLFVAGITGLVKKD